MIAWMLYATGVAALAGVGALAAERALHLYGRPLRWAWAAALAVSLAAPLLPPRGARVEPPVALAESEPAAADGIHLGAASVVAVAPAPAGAAAASPSLARRVETALPYAWGAATLALLLAVGGGAAVLARRRRGWARAVVAGAPVLVSERTGPAVVGFVRPDVVLPRWALSWAEPLQRLIVRHEREHIAAGDPRLLLLALLAAALLPWNPALWWQLRRLRLAMEVDCDARTLRGDADLGAYGELLLRVGRSAGRAPLPVAAFSEPRSFLERRIRMMTSRTPRNRALRAAALAALLLGTAAAARALPAPARPDFARLLPAGPDTVVVPGRRRVTTTDTVVVPARAVAGRPGAVTLAETVVVAPGMEPAVVAAPLSAAGAGATAIAVPGLASTVAVAPGVRYVELAPTGADTLPLLMNAGEVVRAVERAYPPLLRDAGVAGSAEVRIHVTVEGAVARPEVVRATHPAFGPAAVEAVSRARFRPATKDGRPVAATIVLPVSFGLSPAAATTVTTTVPTARARARRDTVPAGVTLEPVDEQPRLVNGAEVSRAVAQAYPPLLRDAGIEGTATVSVRVGEDGRVDDVRLVGATRDEFGEAARRVAERMRFSPARRGGEAVAVRVAIPISFVRGAEPVEVSAASASGARGARAGGSALSLERVRAEVARRHPSVLTAAGADTSLVAFLVDARGAVVQSAARAGRLPAGSAATVRAEGRGRAGAGGSIALSGTAVGSGDLFEVDPRRIQRVDVLTVKADRRFPRDLGVIWVQLRD